MHSSATALCRTVFCWMAIAAVLSFVDRVVAEDAIRPICDIDRGRFECVEGVPYFHMGRKREPVDKPTKWPWKSLQEAQLFELSNTEMFYGTDGFTTIKNLGPGHLSQNDSKFWSDKKSDDDESLPGYLSCFMRNGTMPRSLKGRFCRLPRAG
ncbi:MAG TPA: hypothetical protein VKB78_09615 [Pirellulales bacterium]|nr:hypothetical protein [Pirellulales bacterium]